MNAGSLAAVRWALVVLLAFVAVLGMHVALRHRRTAGWRSCNTLGTVFFLSVGTLICIYLIVINSGVRYQWAELHPVPGGGVGGLWWVLTATGPRPALTLAAWLCPLAHVLLRDEHPGGQAGPGHEIGRPAGAVLVVAVRSALRYPRCWCRC